MIALPSSFSRRAASTCFQAASSPADATGGTVSGGDGGPLGAVVVASAIFVDASSGATGAGDGAGAGTVDGDVAGGVAMATRLVGRVVARAGCDEASRWRGSGTSSCS